MSVPVLKPGDAHVVYTDAEELVRLWYVESDGTHSCRHTWDARNDAVGDPTADPYGVDCPMPPGDGYTLGAPQPCGPNSDDGIAYGWWFIPVADNPEGTFAAHGRAGIGIHGGGSAAPAPFVAEQGWYPTEGCLRMQNEDLGMEYPADGTLVQSVQFVQSRGGTVYFAKE